MVAKLRAWWLGAAYLGVTIVIILLLSASACGFQQRGLNSVYTLGWEGEHFLWASGYVQGIATTMVARYDVRDGSVTLFNMEFQRFVTAQDGSIWTSNDGVRRFDGKLWHDYGLKDGLTGGSDNSLMASRDGSIWVGRGGLNRYDPQTKLWQVVIPSLPNICVSSGCAEIELGTVYALLQTKDGAIWAGTTQGIVRYYDGASMQRWTVNDGLSHNSVRALIEGRDGTIWAGTANGISRKQGNAWQSWSDLHDILTPDHPEIERLLETKDGVIWAATYDRLIRWDGIAWTRVPHCGHEANLFEAHDGSLWIGSDGYGVCKWDGREWHNYTTENGLSDNSVFAIIQSPDGTLWAGSLRGIDRYNPTLDRWQPFPRTP